MPDALAWYDLYVAVCLVCALPLLAVCALWLSLPRAFRERRPLAIRVALGLLAVGTVGLVVPASAVMAAEDATCLFSAGLRCAGALGLLMVFELIAYVRRPSSCPLARVTHGS